MILHKLYYQIYVKRINIKYKTIMIRVLCYIQNVIERNVTMEILVDYYNKIRWLNHVVLKTKCLSITEFFNTNPVDCRYFDV